LPRSRLLGAGGAQFGIATLFSHRSSSHSDRSSQDVTSAATRAGLATPRANATARAACEPMAASTSPASFEPSGTTSSSPSISSSVTWGAARIGVSTVSRISFACTGFRA
jgi:hypothetical protein